MQTQIASRLGFAVLSMALCSTAQALSFRAYLSSTGSDANPCTVSQPCRLLPAALNAIIDGGEVWMLDSANYNSGPVNVTKSASILAIPGAVGSVVALGGPAFNIATAGVSVSLRNLVIVPFPGSGATSGIVMTNGDSLTIQDTHIANLPANGIEVNAPTRVKIMDSVIRNNSIGVNVKGGAMADISNSKIVGNSNFGIFVEASVSASTTSAAINDSLLSANWVGLYAWAPLAGATARWSAIRTTSSHNGYGYACTSSLGVAVCTVGYSMATENQVYGFYNDNATFRSLGNNIVIDNGTNTFGTITPLAGT
jgi:hypothetical protein